MKERVDAVSFDWGQLGLVSIGHGPESFGELVLDDIVSLPLLVLCTLFRGVFLLVKPSSPWRPLRCWLAGSGAVVQ